MSGGTGFCLWAIVPGGKEWDKIMGVISDRSTGIDFQEIELITILC